MTEATEVHSPKYVDDARIVVHPAPELNQALERFLKPELIRGLGGRALELISEKKLSVYDSPFEPAGPESVVPGVSVGELSILQRRLKERQASSRPVISAHVVMRKLQPPKDLEHEGEGIDMRFMVVIDELTRRVLAKTTFVEPRFNAVYVHFGVSRPNMQDGRKLPEAREMLGELLRHRPQRVESMHVRSNALKP